MSFLFAKVRFRYFRLSLISGPPVWAGCLLLISVLGIGGTPTIRAQSELTAQVQSSPTTNANQPATEKFSLSGTVIDSVTGEPIRGALVQIYATQRRTTFSDDNGRFQLESVPRGSYAVSTQKPGYFSEQELRRSGVRPVEAGPDAAPIVVKLAPEAVISGKVAAPSGVALEHVSLSLNYIDIREGRRHWETKGSAITDEDGQYRFANLRPGTYYLGAGPYTPIAESMLESNERPTHGYQEAYYPNAANLAGASPIELQAGQQTEANFALNQVSVYAVSGTVSGYGPNQGVSLQIFDQSGVSVAESYQFSQENGRFDIHPLPAGNYVVRAFSAQAPNQQVQAEAHFTLGADLHNVHLALAPAPSIPVVVQMEGGAKPASSASVAPRVIVHSGPIGVSEPPVSIRLLGAGPNMGEAFASLENPQDPRSLSLRNVAPGRYTAIIEPREGWYVASAEYGSANLLTDDIVVAPGAPPLPLTILLRNDSASLTGTVNIPDKDIWQVAIVAVPQSSPKASPGITFWYPPHDKNSDTSPFALDSLPPGEYLVFAFDQWASLEYANPEVLQSYASRATQVVLSPGQRSKVTLELIRTGGTE